MSNNIWPAGTADKINEWAKSTLGFDLEQWQLDTLRSMEETPEPANGLQPDVSKDEQTAQDRVTYLEMCISGMRDDMRLPRSHRDYIRRVMNSGPGTDNPIAIQTLNGK